MLLILDKVMCGMGRTGTLHACERDGVAPDLLTIAKGLGGGYQSVGAVLLSARIVDAFSKGSGFFQLGHTYIGHPMAAAAGLAVQDLAHHHTALGSTLLAERNQCSTKAHSSSVRDEGCASANGTCTHRRKKSLYITACDRHIMILAAGTQLD